MSTIIDYSGVPQQAGVVLDEDWEPPIHKFFGKKLGNGKTEKEPVYVHQKYPSLKYAKQGEKIVAKLVNSDEELKALGDGWEDTPAAFGYIGAPSFDQLQEMNKPKAAIGRPKAKAE